VKVPTSRKRQFRRFSAALLGLSVLVGGVAKADVVSDFIPSIFATQEVTSLAMIVDPSVFGILGAIGFLALANMRRSRP